MSDFEKAKKIRDERAKTDAAPLVDRVVVSSTKHGKHGEVQEEEKRRTEGIALISLAAERGHADAMCYLGNLQLRRAQDPVSLDNVTVKAEHARRAKEWYEKASRLGCAEASFNLGVLLHDGITVEHPQFIAEDDSESSEIASSGAGSVTINKVSHNRRPPTKSGKVPEQPVEAVAVHLERSLQFFELAAAQGDASATLRSGYCYSVGEGGAACVDASKAVSYLTLALNDDGVAAKAHFYLAQIYRSGLEGADGQGAIEPDEALFLHHLKKAVHGADEDAMHTLASMHLQLALPEGADQGVTEAELAFLKWDCNQKPGIAVDIAVDGSPHRCHHEGPCDHGHAGGQYDSTPANQTSSTVDGLSEHRHPAADPTAVSSAGGQHLERAVNLLRAASAAGQAEATLTLGALVYRGLVRHSGGVGDQGADPKRCALELYELAAEQGSLEAWRNVASMHFLGDGVPRCETTAREIMRVVFGKGS
jgi:TPR repeat protein